MKRLVNTLLILFTVGMAGLAAVLLFVNPDEFRQQMVAEVREQTGYQLTVGGQLRWHIWPKLSILSGPVTLQMPGAEKPLLVADNMRLDVEIWPLLAHRLALKKIYFNKAVLSVSAENEEHNRHSRSPFYFLTPLVMNSTGRARNWSRTLQSIEMKDALLIWQYTPKEQLNIRNIDATVKRQKEGALDVVASGQISYNQRQLGFSLRTLVDEQNYPIRLQAVVSQFNYHLQGIGIPAAGISGQGSWHLDYQPMLQQLKLTDIAVTLNEDLLKGALEADFKGIPDISLTLTAEQFNIDRLLGLASEQDRQTEETFRSYIGDKFIIIGQEKNAYFDFLQRLQFKVILLLNQVLYRDTRINQVSVEAINYGGHLQLQKGALQFDTGRIALNGEINSVSSAGNELIRLVYHVEQLPFELLAKLFWSPSMLSGTVTAQGELKLPRTVDKINFPHWLGEASVKIEEAKLDGLTLYQLVLGSLGRIRSSKLAAQAETQMSTDLATELSMQLTLQQSNLSLQQIRGSAGEIAIATGKGMVALAQQQADIDLQLQLSRHSKNSTALKKWEALLLEQGVILRIYGPWQRLSYEVEMEPKWREKKQEIFREWLNKKKN